MKIALDTQLATGTATGIGEYSRGLARALARCGVRVSELSEPKLDPWRFDRRVMWDQILLPQRARASGAELLHCTSGTMPLRAGMPIVVTVHDVAWLKVQRHTRPYARYYFGTFALRQYKYAGAIIVDSTFSKDELLEVSGADPANIEVVFPGVADDYHELQLRDPEPFVLVPGTVEARKNLSVVIRALPHLPHVRIVSTGPFTAYRDECEALARRLNVADRVEFRGYVSRETLLDLYARCALVAVPSRYEGFGYAAAQALCAGVPVLAARASSLPEVVGNDAPLIDPEDEPGWAEAVRDVLSDLHGARARALSVRAAARTRFAWTASAQAAIRVYERVLR